MSSARLLQLTSGMWVHMFGPECGVLVVEVVELVMELVVELVVEFVVIELVVVVVVAPPPPPPPQPCNAK
eukprot:CAMPEP_0117515426 /NCGR_PEP_ID=MMETSP0784-20121206/30575_1 /TAXON_ID=39447 /ORGANISM="" /LENGTH=69 /DNA_ID=CAMNT_0005311245 /DNA_START=118 /DNA_END=324 /DNA_ORIENTATION=+